MARWDKNWKCVYVLHISCFFVKSPFAGERTQIASFWSQLGSIFTFAWIWKFQRKKLGENHSVVWKKKFWKFFCCWWGAWEAGYLIERAGQCRAKTMWTGKTKYEAEMRISHVTVKISCLSGTVFSSVMLGPEVSFRVQQVLLRRETAGNTLTSPRNK